MYITEEEAKTRLSSLDNLINKLELRKIHRGGRPLGRKNDSLEQRLAVAESAIVNGPTIAAEEHNTTISRASLLSDGVVTHHLGSDEKLEKKIISKKEVVHEKALDIITAALTTLEPKLDKDMKPRDLSAIAADMAKVAERTGNKSIDSNPNVPKVQVVVYAPRVREESEYDVIEVN